MAGKSQDSPTGQYLNQWIGLRESLQETIDFPIKYGKIYRKPELFSHEINGAFRLKFPVKTNPLNEIGNFPASLFE